MPNTWSDIHQSTYKESDWIDKPSLFALDAVKYFPSNGTVLELGAGQGQDSRYFAEQGYAVISTDSAGSALELSKQKLPAKLKDKVTFQHVDLFEELPFDNEKFDVVYAHLSLHYFDHEHTTRIFAEIKRILKPGGVFAFFANSINDPEYKTGKQLGDDFFQIGDMTKRYFSITSARNYGQWFDINLLDDLGETYKDTAKGIHNLIRFIGSKPMTEQTHTTAIACTGAIIERDNNGILEVLLQTRWNYGDAKYRGSLEFPVGRLDIPYENIYDTLAREIKEECGLTLRSVRGDSQTKVVKPRGDDAAFGFQPFCCTQQLANGKPWISFVFVCEVEPGEPKVQLSEAKDPHWVSIDTLRNMVTSSPEKFFTLELPALQYYLQKR
jgi:SAM-dependent methyltransferase